MARISRSRRRKAVRAFVQDRDLTALLRFGRQEPDTAVLVLALAFDRDDTLRWRAIEALGRLCRQIANEEGPEKIRGLVRRVLWLMNDESGGIAWYGPEALAEILVDVPELLGEYGRIIGAFIDEAPFGPGVHRAIAALAPLKADEFEHLRERLEASVGSEDPVERAFGALALSTLSPEAAKAAARALSDDHAEVQVYDAEAGRPRQSTVAALVRPLLSKDHEIQAA